MNKAAYIRAVSLILMLAQLICCLSCAGEDKTQADQKEQPKMPIKLIENRQSDFSIVVDDNAGDDASYAAQYLSSLSRKFCDRSLSIVKASQFEGGAAIFIETIDADADPNTYLIKTEENAIRLSGNSDFAVKCAVMRFINTYLKTPADTVEVPSDILLEETCKNLYLYTLAGNGSDLYDFTLAAACIQGIYNRDSEDLIYIIDPNFSQTSKYLTLLSDGSRWLGMKNTENISGLGNLMRLAGDKIKSVVIWDTSVHASVNVATTIAGVHDGVVMTRQMYENYKSYLPSDVEIIDLTGKFDGSLTQSKKNDAYRYAIDNYLANGLCNPEYLFSYEDSAQARAQGDISYVVCRDFAVQTRGFVYDLSPWEDEVPKDDKKQKLGLDKQTLLMIYSTADAVRGDGLTQLYGFFPFWKYSNNGNDSGFSSKYAPTHVEWEYAYLFTPFDIYWNAVIEDAYNMTVHSKYELSGPLVQNEPKQAELDDDPNKVYILLVMGDYDSSGTFYKRFLTDYETSKRKDIAQAWSINPNILQTYPDIMEYAYEKRGENDYFVSNVGGAGWYNPSRVDEGSWEKVIEHHKKYFKLADMSICPDIWDVEALSETSIKAIEQYAPDGIGLLGAGVGMNGHGSTKKQKQLLSAAGTPVDSLANNFHRTSPSLCAQQLYDELRSRKNSEGASFMSIRVVWVNSEYVILCMEAFQKYIESKGKEWKIEVVDPYVYFDLMEKSLSD